MTSSIISCLAVVLLILPALNSPAFGSQDERHQVYITDYPRLAGELAAILEWCDKRAGRMLAGLSGVMLDSILRDFLIDVTQTPEDLDAALGHYNAAHVATVARISEAGELETEILRIRCESFKDDLTLYRKRLQMASSPAAASAGEIWGPGFHYLDEDQARAAAERRLEAKREKENRARKEAEKREAEEDEQVAALTREQVRQHAYDDLSQMAGLIRQKVARN